MVLGPVRKIWKKTVRKHLLTFLIAVLMTTRLSSLYRGSGRNQRNSIQNHWEIISVFPVFCFFITVLWCVRLGERYRLQDNLSLWQTSGVMFDKDTMQIAYDYKRGEPAS
ncbi:MAG: hypothetical protein IPJ64_14040 [Saprospiraceae bacterium]|nr:hypothetical protein [Saprospiraceae bacterium]